MTRVHLNLTARPHRRDDLLAALDRLELAAAADDAYLLDVEIHVPLDDPDGVLVVTRWPSAEHYARWRHNSGWKRIHDAVEPLLAQEPEDHVFRLVDSIG
jgi:quinol monooxygenase YgiN